MRLLQLLTIFTLLITACNPKEKVMVEKETPTFTKAVAVVNAIDESGVSGVVNFQTTAEGLSVMAEFSGLTEGNHGFHIHEYGDCTATDGTSAGGHFNPNGNNHSNPESMNRHMGDMGNIVADSNGDASKNYMDNTIRIDQIIGRGVIVHAGEDDLTSQPSGAAGSRIACGVIGIAN